MPKFMLDTNIVSYLLKGYPLSIRKHISQYDRYDLCISAITHSELVFGMTKNPHARVNPAVLTFLDWIDTVPWTDSVANCHGKLRAELKQQGIGIDTFDLMIASHAIALDLTLITNDHAFTYIAGLKLENWVDE